MGVIRNFKETKNIMLSDKWIMFFSILPIIIGLVIFYFIGSYVYGDLLDWLKEISLSKVSNETGKGILSYIIGIILTIILYFFVSFTYVLFISIISSPFNDLIVRRIFIKLNKIEEEDIGTSFKKVMRKVFGIIFNEAKKISLIIALSVVAFIFGLIPFLVPVGILISAILVTVNFVDYAWSFVDLSFKDCVTNIKKDFFFYSLSGIIFLGLLSVPILNVVAVPIGVSFYAYRFGSVGKE